MIKESELESFGLKSMSKKSIKDLCKKNKLYLTPRLNNVLYLHFQGYQKIENLEEYTDLTALWLESNAISKITGLEAQTKLKCLYLHNNLITNIENLDACVELDTINLSHNQLINISNCGTDVLPVLSNLNVSHNYLQSIESIVELKKCNNLTVLDVSHNRLDDILVIKIFSAMPELRVLVLSGNPVVNDIPHYRNTMINECKKLTYLDSRPVFPRDRAFAEAWKRGGVAAQQKEQRKWAREDRRQILRSVNDTIRLRNRGAGEPQPKLLSTDDEDTDDENQEIRPSIAECVPKIQTWDEIYAVTNNDNIPNYSEPTRVNTGIGIESNKLFIGSEENIKEKESNKKEYEKILDSCATTFTTKPSHEEMNGSAQTVFVEELFNSNEVECKQEDIADRKVDSIIVETSAGSNNLVHEQIANNLKSNEDFEEIISLNDQTAIYDMKNCGISTDDMIVEHYFDEIVKKRKFLDFTDGLNLEEHSNSSINPVKKPLIEMVDGSDSDDVDIESIVVQGEKLEAMSSKPSDKEDEIKRKNSEEQNVNQFKKCFELHQSFIEMVDLRISEGKSSININIENDDTNNLLSNEVGTVPKILIEEVDGHKHDFEENSLNNDSSSNSESEEFKECVSNEDFNSVENLLEEDSLAKNKKDNKNYNTDNEEHLSDYEDAIERDVNEITTDLLNVEINFKESNESHNEFIASVESKLIAEKISKIELISTTYSNTLPVSQQSANIEDQEFVIAGEIQNDHIPIQNSLLQFDDYKKRLDSLIKRDNDLRQNCTDTIDDLNFKLASILKDCARIEEKIHDANAKLVYYEKTNVNCNENDSESSKVLMTDIGIVNENIIQEKFQVINPNKLDELVPIYNQSDVQENQTEINDNGDGLNDSIHKDESYSNASEVRGLVEKILINQLPIEYDNKTNEIINFNENPLDENDIINEDKIMIKSKEFQIKNETQAEINSEFKDLIYNEFFNINQETSNENRDITDSNQFTSDCDNDSIKIINFSAPDKNLIIPKDKNITEIQVCLIENENQSEIIKLTTPNNLNDIEVSNKTELSNGDDSVEINKTLLEIDEELFNANLILEGIFNQDSDMIKTEFETGIEICGIVNGNQTEFIKLLPPKNLDEIEVSNKAELSNEVDSVEMDKTISEIDEEIFNATLILEEICRKDSDISRNMTVTTEFLEINENITESEVCVIGNVNQAEFIELLPPKNLNEIKESKKAELSDKVDSVEMDKTFSEILNAKIILQEISDIGSNITQNEFQEELKSNKTNNKEQSINTIEYDLNDNNKTESVCECGIENENKEEIINLLPPKNLVEIEFSSITAEIDEEILNVDQELPTAKIMFGEIFQNDSVIVDDINAYKDLI